MSNRRDSEIDLINEYVKDTLDEAGYDTTMPQYSNANPRWEVYGEIYKSALTTSARDTVVRAIATTEVLIKRHQNLAQIGWVEKDKVISEGVSDDLRYLDGAIKALKKRLAQMDVPKTPPSPYYDNCVLMYVWQAEWIYQFFRDAEPGSIRVTQDLSQDKETWDFRFRLENSDVHDYSIIKWLAKEKLGLNDYEHADQLTDFQVYKEWRTNLRHLGLDFKALHVKKATAEQAVIKLLTTVSAYRGKVMPQFVEQIFEAEAIF